MLSASQFSIFLLSSFIKNVMFVSFQQKNEIKNGNTRHTGKPGPETLRKPEIRDPSGVLQKPENRDPTKTGKLGPQRDPRKPENQDSRGTLQKLENRDPSGPNINPTCCKNVLRKQHGQLGFHFLMLFKNIARSQIYYILWYQSSNFWRQEKFSFGTIYYYLWISGI